MRGKLELFVYNIIGLGIFLLIDFILFNEGYVFQKSLSKGLILLLLFNLIEFIMRRRK